MEIVKLETFLTNSGLRNYLFIRLTTDTGMTGIGEASLEWQEQTVETILHEWAKARILGKDPFNIEKNIGEMIRDQYQGGSTVMTAISAIEVACWDIIGKSCGQPIYKLLGGRAKDRLLSYANGWYGKSKTPADYAQAACEVVKRGYPAMKFDPFGVAWKEMTRPDMQRAEDIVAAVRKAVGDDIDLMIEVHGRLSLQCSIEMGRRLEKYRPAFYEEPVTPNSLELLKEAKNALPFRIAGGERLYTLHDFSRIIDMRAVDILQMDPSHCGGLLMSKKIAAMAEVKDIQICPHVSIGPVALCAALHLDWSTPNTFMQENFSEYDVPWRDDYVFGWNPNRNGEFILPDKPGLGIELNTEACAAHPYQNHSFPSLWDGRWIEEFTQTDKRN